PSAPHALSPSQPSVLGGSPGWPLRRRGRAAEPRPPRAAPVRRPHASLLHSGRHHDRRDRRRRVLHLQVPPHSAPRVRSFISKFLRTKGLTSERQLQTFSQSLQELLAEHYKHHWFPEKPCKGSGYRCIRINHKMDPLIGQAAQRIGLSSQELFRLLPSELTLWVDPYEVSYRIGEDGSICVLYEASPAGGSTQNSTNVQMVDSRISCKEELLLGRTSPSKNYNMMTVSG
uniref:Protein BTG1 n=1 Tax=Equus asinus TaxID=9793 RepID=A0A9L0IC34_EQUAS